MDARLISSMANVKVRSEPRKSKAGQIQVWFNISKLSYGQCNVNYLEIFLSKEDNYKFIYTGHFRANVFRKVN